MSGKCKGKDYVEVKCCKVEEITERKNFRFSSLFSNFLSMSASIPLVIKTRWQMLRV